MVQIGVAAHEASNNLAQVSQNSRVHDAYADSCKTGPHTGWTNKATDKIGRGRTHGTIDHEVDVGA